jgi:hypothetical protein
MVTEKKTTKTSFMKKVTKKIIVLAIFTMLSTAMVGRQTQGATPSIPRWISDKGYWIVESNIKTPDTSVIYFYNNDNIRVYSEKVNGIILNLEKRKTLMRLKKALDQSLLSWKQSHFAKDNVQLVSNIFKP